MLSVYRLYLANSDRYFSHLSNVISGTKLHYLVYETKTIILESWEYTFPSHIYS